MYKKFGDYYTDGKSSGLMVTLVYEFLPKGPVLVSHSLTGQRQINTEFPSHTFMVAPNVQELNYAIKEPSYIPSWMDGIEVGDKKIVALGMPVIGYYRVIVAGSRSFRDYNFLEEKLKTILKNRMPYVEIVNGLAEGADRLGGVFADHHGLPQKKFAADWDNLGKAAGILRNEDMGRYADALVAFWNGESRGTAHMIDFATKNNLAVKVIRV